MNDSNDYEMNARARNKIEELRIRQSQRLIETEKKLEHEKRIFEAKLNREIEKDGFRMNLERFRLDRKEEEARRAREYRNKEIEDKRNYERALDEARAGVSIDLEALRYELRQAERLPNFEDHKMRMELDFLIQRETRLDINRLDNVALQRRITELRALNRGEIQKIIVGVVLEHIQRERDTKRTIAEIEATTQNEILRADRSTENDLVRAEQAHQHREKEMFTSRFLDVVFSKLADSSGLSREDLKEIEENWIKNADKLKR